MTTKTESFWICTFLGGHRQRSCLLNLRLLRNAIRIVRRVATNGSRFACFHDATVALPQIGTMQQPPTVALSVDNSRRPLPAFLADPHTQRAALGVHEAHEVHGASLA